VDGTCGSTCKEGDVTLPHVTAHLDIEVQQSQFLLPQRVFGAVPGGLELELRSVDRGGFLPFYTEDICAAPSLWLDVHAVSKIPLLARIE
jgi:hypothetical protein